jgi:hypothetical protein
MSQINTTLGNPVPHWPPNPDGFPFIRPTGKVRPSILVFRPSGATSFRDATQCCPRLSVNNERYIGRGSLSAIHDLVMPSVLTYMATLDDLIAAQVLKAFELPDWEPRLPVRPLWVTDGFVNWADDTVELHDKALGVGSRKLFEHLLQMLCDFRCGERHPTGDLRRVIPTSKGVWKLHPPKLRVYGWCPQQHAFVAITGALESDTKKDRSLNNKKRDEVLRFAKAHKVEHTILRGDISAIFPYPVK